MHAVFAFVVRLAVPNWKSVDVGVFSWPQWKVEAAVLPDITTRLPASPVSIDRNWRHLSGLSLANPELGVPWKHFDVLLCVDMFS